MNIGQAFTQIWGIVKSEELKVALPALLAFFSSAASNPSSINIIAQAGKLMQDLIAAQPAIEQSLLGQIASIIQAEATTLAAQAAAPKA